MWCFGESRRQRQGTFVLWDVLCASSELILEVWPLNISQPINFRGLLGIQPCVQMPPCCICFWSKIKQSLLRNVSAKDVVSKLGARMSTWPSSCNRCSSRRRISGLVCLPCLLSDWNHSLNPCFNIFTSLRHTYGFGLIVPKLRSQMPCQTLSCSDWRGLKAIWLQSSGLETNPQSHYLFPGSPFLKIRYPRCYRSLWGCCPKWIALLNQRVCWIPAAPTIRAMDAVTWI